MMPLPPSFSQSGFSPGANALKSRQRIKLPNGKYLKPLMILTEGETDSGKTEFIMSCPPPGIVIALDRQFDGCLDNPNPPEWRQQDSFYFDITSVPPETTAEKPTYQEYYIALKRRFYAALDNPDALTVAIDGDSDFWELQRLSTFGKLTQVLPREYHEPYAQRRAMTAKAWDSGKIVVSTNKVRDEWENYITDKGKEAGRRTGRKISQGFPDSNYLWQIILRHLYEPAHEGRNSKWVPHRWGIQIVKCKMNMELVGAELWGDECNFAGLVQLIYPDIPLEDWGF